MLEEIPGAGLPRIEQHFARRTLFARRILEASFEACASLRHLRMRDTGRAKMFDPDQLGSRTRPGQARRRNRRRAQKASEAHRNAPPVRTGKKVGRSRPTGAGQGTLFAFDRLPAHDRNILICMLTKPATRRLFGKDWADEAKRMVAQFRATHDLWAGDPAFTSLLERLRQGSPEFAAWWTAHDIRNVAGGRKQLEHPKKGKLRFEHASFQANDDPALKLVIYTPA